VARAFIRLRRDLDFSDQPRDGALRCKQAVVAYVDHFTHRVSPFMIWG